MKKSYLKCLLPFVFTIPLINSVKAQNYVQAYVVTTQNDTLRGFIRERDSGATFPEIKFKKTITDNSPTIFLPGQIKAFYLTPFGELYITETVDIDKKPDKISELEVDDRAPKFVRDVVFLKLLAKGKASLYYHVDNTNKHHFFLQFEGGPIKELLLIKFYFSNTNNKYAQSSSSLKHGQMTMENYKEQLKQTLVGCQQDYTHVPYAETVLKKVVLKYNQCVGSPSSYAQKDIKGTTTPYVIGGVVFASGSYSGKDNYKGTANVSDINFNSSSGPTIGFGIENRSGKPSRHISMNLEVFWTKYAFSGNVSKTNYVGNNETKQAEFSCSNIQFNASGRYNFSGKLRPFVGGGLSFGFLGLQNNHMVFTTDRPFDVLKSYEGPIAPFSSTMQGILVSTGISLSRLIIEARYSYGIIAAQPTQSQFHVSGITVGLACKILRKQVK